MGLATTPVNDPATVDASGQVAISAEWWQGFGDEQLNPLVVQALAFSPSLKLAQARLARRL